MSDRQTIIGFVGFPGSGKDAAATVMCARHSFIRYAFGDMVKGKLLEIDPIYENDITRLERWKRSGLGETREKLQNLGESMRRDDSRYWINRMPEVLGHRSVFTDIRYKNEMEWVREKGGVILHIDRPGYGPVNDHQSEKNTGELATLADYTITNQGTINDLVARILTLA